MLSRPVDSSGDILPVLIPPDLLSDASAVSVGLRDHLNLFTGDWWENLESGNEIFDLISISRKSESDIDTLSAALCAYIREFPGAASVSNVQACFLDQSLRFSCSVHTEQGEEVPIIYVTP